MRKIIAAILVLVMMLSMTACVPEDPKTVEITVSGVTEGAPISAATVEVTYGVETVAHEISWGVAKGDEIVDLGGLTEFGVGYYQLTVTYTLPKDAGEVPVVVSGGELTGTQALGDGKYAATFGFYFAGMTVPEQRLITITVTGAEKGANISDAAVSVTYGPIVLDSSISWGVAMGDELVDPEAGQTFGTGVYQATVIYTIPAELYPTDGEGIPVMCAAGELGMTQALGNEQYSAQILFAFQDEEIDCEHEWIAQPHTGTCTEGLVKHAVCSVCGKERSDQEPPSDHFFDWSNATVVQQPTCSSEGKKTAVCQICGATAEASVPATGKHSYESFILGGNCLRELEVRYVCRGCGASYEESISFPSHTFGKPEVWTRDTHIATCIYCGATEVSPHNTDHTGLCVECGYYVVN